MKILYRARDNLSFIVEDREVIYNIFLKGCWDENTNEFTEEDEVWFESISEGSIECYDNESAEILKFVKDNIETPITLSSKLMN